MPERIDGLTRVDVKEIFGIYARTNDLSELRILARRDNRFRRAAFHGMLRQEHIRLKSRTDLDEDLKEWIQFKYHFFFGALHHDTYDQRISELAPNDTSIPQLQSAVVTSDTLIATSRSTTELALALACILSQLGTLEEIVKAGTIELPLIVDRNSPQGTIDLLNQAADGMDRPVPEHIRSGLYQRATIMPDTHRSLAASLIFRCIRCGVSFPDLHRYFIDATDPQRFSQPIMELLVTHQCPHCQSTDCYATALLANEAATQIDPLLASCCLIIPSPHSRLFLPPHLTLRDEDNDRILEVRLSELETRCEEIIPRGAHPGITSYGLAYTRQQVQAILAEGFPTVEDESYNTDLGRRFVEEIVRKVDSGTLPLDMAMEHVRRIARAKPTLTPPIPLFSDVGGMPERHLTSVLVTRAFYDEHQGGHDLKALLSIFAYEAYLRMGAQGLARGELERARAFRESAQSGGLTDAVDRLLLESEVQQAEKEHRFDDATAKLEQLVEQWGTDFIYPPQTAGDLQDAYNQLVMKNRLGCAYTNQQRWLDALNTLRQVESLAIEYRGTLPSDAKADNRFEAKRTNDLLELRSRFRYLQGGALANQGCVFRTLSTVMQLLLANTANTALKDIQPLDMLQALEASQEKGDDQKFISEALTATLDIVHGAPTFAEAAKSLHAEAVKKYERALEVTESVDGHYFAAIQANALYELLRERDGIESEKMESYLRAAIRHARAISALDMLTSAISSLSKLKEQASAVEEAAELGEAALRVMMRWRVACGVDRLRENLGDWVLDGAARVARLRDELQQPTKVLEAIESAKCGLLALELERSPLRLSELPADDPLMRELQLLESVRARAWGNVARTEGSAFRTLQGELPPQSEVSTDELEAVEDRIKELQQELRSRHPRFDAWCRWSTVELFQLRDIQQASSRWRVPVRIVGFFVRREILWWYQINGDEVQVGKKSLGSGGAARLSAQVVRLRGHLVRDDVTETSYKDALGYLSSLLSPAFECIPHTPGEPTLVCPHDSLLWFPWPVLLVCGKQLLEAGPIFTTPGLSIMASLGNRIGSTTNLTSLVVADPQEGCDGALPSAAFEADVLNEKFGVNCTILKGKAATLDAVVGAVTGKNIVHFGCHGHFGGFMGDVGRLLLASGLNDQDGYGSLTCSKIVEMLDLREAMLVNLAACDSGLVRPDEGTEIDGITRAFLAAGASAVLGSLWPLEDDAARVFSDAFYDNLIATGEPGTALRETQLACKSGRYGAQMSSLRNWAGYALLGSPPEVASPPLPDGWIAI